MARPKSRPARWAEACAKAADAKAQLEDALSELEDLRCEYEEWKDNLPENLQTNGPLAEKLEAIVNLDFESAKDGLDVIEEAEAADLPRGFGKD